MLTRVFGIRRDELTYGFIRELVSRGEPEGQYVEFKSELPTKSGAGYLEFARDVTALANAGGGVIVFGVKTKLDCAAELTPVQLGGTASTLIKTLNSNVMPRLREIRESELSADTADAGAVVLEIGPSPLAPHLVAENAGFSCWRRVARDKTSVSESELERMYGNRSSLVVERTRVLEACEATAARNSTPSALRFVAVPLAASPRVFPSSVEAVQRVRAVALRHNSCGIDPNYPEAETALRYRCVEVSQVSGTELKNQSAWFTFADDGSFVRVVKLHARREEYDDFASDVTIVIDDQVAPIRLAEMVVVPLLKYRELCREFDVGGSVLLSAGVTVGSRVVGLATDGSPRFVGVLKQDAVSRYSIEAEDLFRPEALLSRAGQILEDLHSGFGNVAHRIITPDGSIDLGPVGRGLRPAVEDWLERVGLRRK